MARPTRSDTGEVASKVIPVRVTASEHAEINAKKGDLGQSEFMRRAALDKDIPQQSPQPSIPEVNWQTYQALHDIGVNLNQQVKACNVAAKQGQELPIEPEVIEALAEQVEAVRMTVIGADDDASEDDDSHDPA